MIFHLQSILAGLNLMTLSLEISRNLCILKASSESVRGDLSHLNWVEDRHALDLLHEDDIMKIGRRWVSLNWPWGCGSWRQPAYRYLGRGVVIVVTFGQIEDWLKLQKESPLAECPWQLQQAQQRCYIFQLCLCMARDGHHCPLCTVV